MAPLEIVTTLRVGSVTQLTQGLGYRAQSVYVENYTNQYVSIPDVQAFIPPFTARLLSLNGPPVAQMSFAAPPGVTQVASVTGQVCNATWSAAPIPVTGGPIGPIGVTSNYYDRNPLSISANTFVQSAGPHALTVRNSYTVPANRKAFIEFISLFETYEAAGDLATGKLQSAAQITPVAQATVVVANAFSQGAVALNTLVSVQEGTSIELQPGDLLELVTANSYTATTGSHNVAFKGTEFDA